MIKTKSQVIIGPVQDVGHEPTDEQVKHGFPAQAHKNRYGAAVVKSIADLEFPTAVAVPWIQRFSDCGTLIFESLRDEQDLEVLHTPNAVRQLETINWRGLEVVKLCAIKIILQDKEEFRNELVSAIKDTPNWENVVADFDCTVREEEESLPDLEANAMRAKPLNDLLCLFEKNLREERLDQLCPLSRLIRIEIVCFVCLGQLPLVLPLYHRALDLFRKAVELRPNPDVWVDVEYLDNVEARLEYLEQLCIEDGCSWIPRKMQRFLNAMNFIGLTPSAATISLVSKKIAGFAFFAAFFGALWANEETAMAAIVIALACNMVTEVVRSRLVKGLKKSFKDASGYAVALTLLLTSVACAGKYDRLSEEAVRDASSYILWLLFGIIVMTTYEKLRRYLRPLPPFDDWFRSLRDLFRRKNGKSEGE